MGVSGCGKTTIGQRLSDHSGEALQGSIRATKTLLCRMKDFCLKVWSSLTQMTSILSQMHSWYLSQPHIRRWCTFVKLVYFFAQKMWHFCIYRPALAILSRIYALFGVLFTGLNNLAVCQNGQLSVLVNQVKSFWDLPQFFVQINSFYICQFFVKFVRSGKGKFSLVIHLVPFLVKILTVLDMGWSWKYSLK